MTSVAGLVGLLLPLRCLGCGERVPEGADAPVCARCRTRLAPLPSPRCDRCDLPTGTRRVPGPECPHCRDWPEVLVRARCVTALAAPAADLLHALKYEGWPVVAPFLATRMANVLAHTPHWREEGKAAVVAVPTTERRARERGYNQAGLLAEGVARALGLEVVTGLVRRHATDSQIALQVDERRANVERAFRAAPDAARLARFGHLILVDDVITSGATVAAAARALQRLGARSVTALAFARALPRDLDPVSPTP